MLLTRDKQNLLCFSSVTNHDRWQPQGWAGATTLLSWRDSLMEEVEEVMAAEGDRVSLRPRAQVSAIIGKMP